jgi:gamma-glutamyltranspeptidase/glutathione hydrolase
MVALTTSACVTASDPTGRTVRIQAAVAADDPKAAMIGREILEAGGSAGDAAAAMAMTMAVTLPARAGLGGGGICLAYDRADGQVRALDFLPRVSGTHGAVPGTPRGVYALHAALGRLRWEEIVAPAEALARGDRSISRAAALDLADFEAVVMRSDEARRIFAARGRTPDEGQPLAQLDLAATLAALRQRGVGAVHSGPLANRIAEAAGLAPEELRGYQPRWIDTVSTRVGNDVLHLADTEGSRALLAAWTVGVSEAPDRAVRVLDALGAGTGGAGVPSAGFAVLDAYDQAVACAFTMGAPFGTEAMVPGTGLFLARPAGDAGIGGPVMLTNANTRRLLYAASGSTGLPEEGPAGAPAAAVTTTIALLERGLTPEEAVGAVRIAPAGDGAVLVERMAPASLGESLGRPVRVIPTLGRTNFVHCGVDRSDGSRDCQALTDPRGFGLALTGG